jgi:hypothetical protein
MNPNTTFKSLKIEAPIWGEHKGKLVATICVSGKNSETTMILPDSVGEKILHLVKEAIIDGVEQAANDFIFELTTLIPDQLLLK